VSPPGSAAGRHPHTGPTTTPTATTAASLTVPHGTDKPAQRRCVRCLEWFEPEGRYDYVCTSTCNAVPPELTGICPICGATFTAKRQDKRTCGTAKCKKALQRRAAKSERWALAAKVVPLYHRDGKQLRLCECGCRKPLTGAAQQRFYDDACRKRSSRRRRPGSMSHLVEGPARDTRVVHESGHGEIRANDSGAPNNINKANSDTLGRVS
jgi:hypothetical protein